MSSLPLAQNQIEIQRVLTTSSTAIFVPFTTQELFQEGEALYYLRQLEKQHQREVCFSDLTPEQENQLSAYDDLLEINYFRTLK